VQDFVAASGPTETADRLIVRVGEQCGFDVVGVTPKHFFPQVLHDAQLIVISTFFQFVEEQQRTIIGLAFDEKTPFVRLTHTVRDIENVNGSRPIYQRALANFVVSPTLYDLCRRDFGVDAIVLDLSQEKERYKFWKVIEERIACIPR
jgi:hypothetical protein